MSVSNQQRAIHLLRMLVQSEGTAPSPLEGVKLVRTSGSVDNIPLCEPSIVIVCRDEDPGHPDPAQDSEQLSYIVLPVPLPFEAFVQPGACHSTIAVCISIDLQLATELVLALHGLRHRPLAVAAIESTELDDCMSNALLRLLQALGSRQEAQVLGPGIVKELLYRALTGPQGGAIHAAICQQNHLGRIGKALRRIHADYDRQVDVASLASEAGMSIAAFHSHFKAVTQTTPIQYLKTTRLQKARLLMIQDGIGAATASRLVGYESTSQFSREFKRFFGRTPTHEAAVIKDTVRQPDVPWPSAYVADVSAARTPLRRREHQRRR